MSTALPSTAPNSAPGPVESSPPAAHSPVTVGTEAAPRLVLDTQVVMEWLVFRDAGIRALTEPIEAGRWTWIGCSAMRDELLHVLSRGIAARWNPDPLAIAEVFARLCQMSEPADAHASVPLLKCRDKDDQKFIDLALACKVDALISRDSDVLALAKRAKKQGLAILRPEQWLAQREAGGTEASVAPDTPGS